MIDFLVVQALSVIENKEVTHFKILKIMGRLIILKNMLKLYISQKDLCRKILWNNNSTLRLS
jgi:hypothetical protein